MGGARCYVVKDVLTGVISVGDVHNYGREMSGVGSEIIDKATGVVNGIVTKKAMQQAEGIALSTIQSSEVAGAVLRKSATTGSSVIKSFTSNNAAIAVTAAVAGFAIGYGVHKFRSRKKNKDSQKT